MNNYVTLSVTAAPQLIISRLCRANIAIYQAKKQRNGLTFMVNDKNVKKVFAIFEKPCYNVTIQKKSSKGVIRHFLHTRFGVCIGAVLFVALVLCSQLFVFRIQVTGSGSYLKNEIEQLLSQQGITIGSYTRHIPEQQLKSQILSLPAVNFCTIEKRGSILKIDVQTGAEQPHKVTYGALKAEHDGKLEKLVVICGRTDVQEGQMVQKGQTLIYDEIVSDEHVLPTYAVGYAILRCQKQEELFFEQQTEQNERKAVAIATLDLEVEQTFVRKIPVSNGIKYMVTVEYLYRQSINVK